MISGRLLGIDVGDARIGIAVSDESRTLASALGIVVRAKGKAARRIAQIACERGVEAIVVGLPENADGTLGPQAKKAQNFAERVTAELRETAPQITVVLWNEYLSTQEAREKLLMGGSTRKQRQQPVDALAAAIILQEYMDHERTKKRNGTADSGSS